MTISKTVALPLGYTLMKNLLIFRFTQRTVKSITNNQNKFLRQIILPTTVKKFAVLRSPTVNKNSFEYFGVKTKKKLLSLNINFVSSSAVKTYVEKKILNAIKNFNTGPVTKKNISSSF